MMNPVTVESLCSAAYIEDFLDCVENLPDEMQRNISRMRELDVRYQDILRELESQQIHLIEEDFDGTKRKRVLIHIQRSLITAQEIGDEKLQLVQLILDTIENKSRQLDVDYKNMGQKAAAKDQENAEPTKAEPQPERSSKRARRQRNDASSGGGGGTGGGAHGALSESSAHEKAEEKMAAAVAAGNKKSKKKKRRSKGAGAAEKEAASSGGGGARGGGSSPVEQPIDPDEPTYCSCQQISYGEMIGCDNERCSIEWFHFSCVGLITKPKGKWYCPRCRGDRPNVMKASRL